MRLPPRRVKRELLRAAAERLQACRTPPTDMALLWCANGAQTSHPMNSGNPQTEATNALKVFIVEDSVNMQVALADLVCSVTAAEIVGVVASEATAVDWVKSNAGCWDVAIVDLTLEEGDGFSIVRRLKSEPECGVLVVFSGYVTDVIRRHCRSLGADAVFHKTESRQLAEFIEEFAANRLAS